ncbi:hypothetical protein IE978_30140 [Klebsiella pneumoniae]|uniref:Uncharacterized protein n=1 Tax=Klebsiella pneumoniae TaxID=573 RepID=A0A927E133_KLEPN|nr:hypothetical protein [Klebsiella pneumoniae]
MEERYYILEITNEMIIESIIELYKDYIESLESFTEEVKSISAYHQWNMENRSEVYYLERTNIFSANEYKKIEVCEKTFYIQIKIVREKDFQVMMTMYYLN